MKKVLFSLMAMLLFAVSGIAQTTYTMVNSASQLEAGAQYVLVGYDNDGQAFIMSYQKSNNRHAIAISEAGGVITATVATDPSQQDAPYEFTLDGAAGAWTIYDPLNNGYLCAPGGGNYLRTQTALDDFGRWTITDGDEGGMVPVSNGGAEQRYMRYNITSTLFGCYKESSNVAAPVYFFKAGNAPIDPEPCEYPTNFRVTEVNGVDVTLEWTDADCEGMNIKYLVIGSTGSIPIPSDNVSVSDDLLYKNIGSGIETVTFNGLASNTHYNFAIFPYTNGGSNTNYKTDGDYPTDDATTENIEYILFEDFNDELGVFMPYDAYGDQSWHHGEYNGITYANMNGYANGAPHQNEDWLISPPIEVGFDEWEEITFEFRSAKKFDGPENDFTVMISMYYDGQSDPTDNIDEWEDITDAFELSQGNYEWVESGQYVMFEPEVGRYYFAFRYISTDDAASSWEVDYVKVMGKSYVSVNENSVQTVSLYPNPANEQVTFTLESDAQVGIFDMAGRKVSETECKVGQAQINVNELESGVYFVNFRFANGGTAVSKFVKF